MDATTLTPDQFAGLDGVADWRFVLGRLHAHFQVGSLRDGALLAAAIAHASEAFDQHPDIDLRPPGHVRVVLEPAPARGVTNGAVELARNISKLADGAGARAEPSASQALEIAIDTMDPDRIRPFWTAVLGYLDDGGTLVDPHRIGPPVWFQQMDAARPGRGRFHLDVSVAHDVAEARIAAALAAGGTLVTDRFARAWWVLADADGNEVCVSTWQDR